MRRVLVEPIGVTVEVAEGRTLLDAITNAAVSVPTDCRGRGICGKCLVRLGAGEVTPPTQAEVARLSPQQLPDGWRLACQATPTQDKVSIDVRETSGRRQILTASKLHHGAVPPGGDQVGRRVSAAVAGRRPLGRRQAAGAPPACRAAAERAAAGARPAARPRLASPRHPVRAADRRHRAAGRRHRRLRCRRRHRHLQDRRLPLRPGRRPADRPGGPGEPPDALRRGRRHAHHTGDDRQPRRAGAQRARGHQRRPAAPLRAPAHRGPQPLRHDRGRQHGHASPGARRLSRGPGRAPFAPASTSRCSCAPPSWAWP